MTTNNSAAIAAQAIEAQKGAAAPVRNAAERMKGLKVNTYRNGDILIQPEADAAGGKGAAGKPFTPINKPESGEGDDDILISDDDFEDGDGEDGNESDKDAECKGNCKEGGEGEAKGKCTCPNCQGKGGDNRGGEGQGQDNGTKDGQQKKGGDNGDGNGSKPKYKIGDKVRVKNSGEEKVVTGVNADGSYVLS